MAKFKDLDLRLNTGEKAMFGDGQQAQFTYTTISGYNTPSGVVDITPISQFVVNVPIAGEQATKPYHLVRFDQLADSMSDINPLDWQDSVTSFSGTPPTSPVDGERYVVTSGTGLWTGHDDEVATWDSGTSTWVFLPPNEGMTLRDDTENQFYTYDGTDWGLFLATTDHGSMDGLGDDDHTQYILVDGSRGFTNTVSGVDPVSDGDLVTKRYVDTISGSLQEQIDNLDSSLSGDYVTTDTEQTISGSKTFADGTLTTFLGDVFFDGINITMSGTTLNTESGATFNYDSTSTITNSGTTTYGDGSTITHEDGSTETHETGSEDIYEAGSTITNSGTTTYGDGSTVEHESGSTETYDSGSTITNSGTTTYGDGSTVTHEDGSSEVYEGGSITTHVSGSIDVYNDGSVLTFSGSNVDFIGDTTVNYGGDTVTTYEDNSTINNNGDTIYGDTSTTVYEDGSEVTFSGTTIFETTPVFNEGLTIASGTTLNLEGVTISGTFTDSNKKWGKIAVINAARSQAVTFDTPWLDDDYVVVATLTNEIDATPSIYSTIQGVKTGAGFTTHFSGKIDSGDFMLEWFAFKGQSH